MGKITAKELSVIKGVSGAFSDYAKSKKKKKKKKKKAASKPNKQRITFQEGSTIIGRSPRKKKK